MLTQPHYSGYYARIFAAALEERGWVEMRVEMRVGKGV